MRGIYVYITVVMISLLGCEDYLDKAPELGLTEDDVFLEYESARGYLDENYNQLDDIHNWDNQNLRNANESSLSDETASVTFHGNANWAIQTLNSGDWLNKPNLGEVGWSTDNVSRRSTIIGRAFPCIRIANKVIANAEKIPNISEEELNGLLGQAHFFRGWWYFQIIIRWGGMPVFDKVFSPNDNMDLPRLTYHESTEWLISDMDKAIELLPHRWIDEQFGRATKGSAYALKAMAALYASSPLMSNNLNVIQDNGYDLEWSKRAAEYAHNAIVYIEDGIGGHGYRLMSKDEYEFIFYHEDYYASDESLWFRLDGGRRNIRDLNASYTPRRHWNAGGQGNTAMNFSNPTQNIVDKFETLDGYPIDHPASNYDPQNPYVNRDPRFYNNILIPGGEWGVNRGNKPLYLETYVGGTEYNQLAKAPASSSRMPSGYLNKKFIWPEGNGYTRDFNKYSLNNIYIRVSQLYLDFAEAMNEAYGPTSNPEGFRYTAVDAINKIRNRVGMPAVRSEFTGSREAFRERIRNERAVELMFENHRWFDLRRWMLAEDVFSEPIRGIRAYPPAGHRMVNDKSSLDFTYEVVDLVTEQRVFTSRHYWYPLALDHVDNLYNLQQNPGW
jgi:hypothetical protein